MMMENNQKLPFKMIELSISKFNDVAIPHNVGLLSNHKSNIEKSLALGDWIKIKKEEINAVRVIKQLKNYFIEMDMLREKVKDEDLEKFDQTINMGKQRAMKTIDEYMAIQLKSPTSTITSQQSIDDDLRIIDTSSDYIQTSIPQIQADYQPEQHQLMARQLALEEHLKLQNEIEDMHSMFTNVHELVHEQGEQIDVVADNCEEAVENVYEAEATLSQALKYKRRAFPVMGAILGTCVGGPIGLLVGIKAGGLAAVGCAILGFTGGTVLKKGDIVNGIEEEKKDD